MQFTATQIAALIGGSIEGDAQAAVSQFSKIEEATETSLAFIANPKYEHLAENTKAKVLIVSKEFDKKIPQTTTLIRVNNPYECLPVLLQAYQKAQSNNTGVEKYAMVHEEAKVDQTAYIGSFSYISKGAVIGKNVKIYPNVFIGENTVIADDTIVFSNVSIYHEVKIGARCIIHSGCILGADGFGFAPQKDGTFLKVPQTGNVIIEDDVELGANVNVDRATMGSTIIKKGVKLDNAVHIAHNVTVGENTVIAAQVAIAGSSKLGKNVMIGGQAGITGHVEVGDFVRINAQAAVSKNTADGKSVGGSPAQDYREWQRLQVLVKKLPDMVARIEELEKKLKNEEIKK